MGNETVEWLSPPGLDLWHELAPPALDCFGELTERASAACQLVSDAHRRSRVYVPHQQATGFQVLQPRREHLVSRAFGALGDLAEAQGSPLQDIEDQRIPRPPQYLDGGLERAALGIHGLRHGAECNTFASQEKAP